MKPVSLGKIEIGVDAGAIFFVLSEQSQAETYAWLTPNMWEAVKEPMTDLHPQLPTAVVELDMSHSGRAIGFPALEEPRSLFNLAWLLTGVTDSTEAAAIFDGWATLDLAQRSSRWATEIRDARPAAQAQILGLTRQSPPPFENIVPDWLPEICFAGNRMLHLLDQNGPRIRWSFTASPLGRSAFAYFHVGLSRMPCLGVSDGPLFLPHDRGAAQKAGDAVRWLREVCDILASDDHAQSHFGWSFSAHDVIAITGQLLNWEERLCSPPT
jgi:hypothetical protein